MVSKKLNFTEFYELLLEAKEEKSKSIKEDEQILYANYLYWGKNALDEWLYDTELMEKSSKRNNIEIISKITEEKGYSMGTWIELVCETNSKHHKMLEELKEKYNISKEEVLDIHDSLIDKITEELISEYNINPSGAY